MALGTCNGRIVALFAAIFAVCMVKETTAACTAPCKAFADHSSHEYCIARPYRNCENAENMKCPPCDLWVTKVKPGCNKFYYSKVHVSHAGPEWIIAPCFPVTGIDAILASASQANATNFLWDQEWTDAVNGNNHRTKLSPNQLGLVMNSYYYRSMHQLHIHAGNMRSKFSTNCLEPLPKSVRNSWVAPSGGKCTFNTRSRYARDLNSVNALIRAGAKVLNIGDDNKVGAMVSGNIGKNFNTGKGFLVTVFQGDDYHGDHDILNY